MKRKLAIFWACVIPLGWLGVAGVGIWGFVTLGSLDEFTANGTPRTMADKAVPYAFLLLVPLGLYYAWKEFREAQAEIPLAEAADEAARQRRQRQKAVNSTTTDRYPLDADQRESLIGVLDILRVGSVLAPEDVDNDRFITLAETLDLEDADLHEGVHVLDEYGRTYGAVPNLFFLDNHVEVHESGVLQMVRDFARLAGRENALDDLSMKMLDPKVHPAPSEVRFTLDGTPHVFPFKFYNKHPSGTLMDALAALFETGSARFANAFFDSVFLVSRLEPSRYDAMNALIEEDYDQFIWMAEPDDISPQ